MINLIFSNNLRKFNGFYENNQLTAIHSHSNKKLIKNASRYNQTHFPLTFNPKSCFLSFFN
jgi:hypothetical protein